MSKETSSKGFKIPKRVIVVIMTSLAMAVQYTIRSSLSVTIVAMVKSTELETHLTDSINSLDSLLNNFTVIKEPIKLIGCPLPERSQLDRNHTIIKSYRGPKKLDYSESTQDLLLGAFFYGYIVTHVFAGQISAIFGGQKTIFYSILLSSVFTLLTPVATTFHPSFVIILRALIGCAQGVLSPAIYTLFANWICESERSRAISFFTMGGFIGSVVTMPLSGYLCEYGNFFDLVEGWPTVFYFLGILALIFVVFWWLIVYDHPSKHPSISSDELAYILKTPKNTIEQKTLSYKLEEDTLNNNILVKKKTPKVGSNVPWMKLLTLRDVWVVAIAKFCTAWSNLLMMSKLPTYLDRVLHMSLQKNSIVNAALYIAICLSAMAMGSLSDMSIKKGWMNKNISRKFFESIALFGSGAIMLIIPLVSCNENAVSVLMIMAAMCYAAISGGDNVIVYDLSAKYSASIYGITNAVGSTPGFLAPLFVGFILNIEESVEKWNIIFIGSSLIACFGGVIFILFASVEPIKDLNNDDDE